MSKKRHGSPTITSRQRARFLGHLAETANVTASAIIAGFDRRTAYEHRIIDAEFAAAWEDALDQATDTLEAEARRRALEGCREPVVNKDGLVYDENQVPMYVQKYSDTLMITLLKAHRPSRFATLPQPATAPSVPTDLQRDPEPVPDEPGPANPIR
jgi:hypothetical protein